MGCSHSARTSGLLPGSREGDGLSLLGSREEVEHCDSFHQNYVMGVKLGWGSFGEVRRRAEHRLTKLPVAVKVWDLARSSSGDLGSKTGRRDVRGPRRRKATAAAEPGRSSKDPAVFLERAARTEVATLKAIGQHRHCLRFHESFTEGGHCFVVTELWKASLPDFLQGKLRVTAAELRRVLKEMAFGLAHVHQAHFVHRNVRPSNFLVGGADGSTVKLADFGAAAPAPKDHRPLFSVVGAAAYMSPEMIGEEGYDQCTDVWSLGATYYAIAYGECPYSPSPGAKSQSPGKIKAAVLFGTPEPKFRQADGAEGRLVEAPEAVEDLVRSCLLRDALLRPSVAQVLQHPFLQSEEEPLRLPVRKGQPGVSVRANCCTEPVGGAGQPSTPTLLAAAPAAVAQQAKAKVVVPPLNLAAIRRVDVQ